MDTVKVKSEHLQSPSTLNIFNKHDKLNQAKVGMEVGQQAAWIKEQKAQSSNHTWM
jgi:hypothetical protein